MIILIVVIANAFHDTGYSEQGTGTLTGKVSDPRTGQGIEGATISIPVGLETLCATTDGTGSFRMSKIPAGINFPAAISHPGYKDVVHRMSIRAGKATQLDVALSSVYLRLLYPNGGESIFAGSEISITWISVGIKTVRLEYSINNGRNWRLITAGTDASKGSYMWDVPDIPTKEYLIRITNAEHGEISDVSDATFANSST